MRICGTGHRPDRLGLDYSDESNQLLREFIKSELVQLTSVTSVVSGMATGFDQALAEAAIELRLPLVAALPFVGMDAKWPLSGRHRYRKILDQASNVHVVCDGGYSNKKYYERDKWMVDNSDTVLSLYDYGTTKSGTGITVGYAVEQGRPVINLWDKWYNYRPPGEPTNAS